MSSNRHTTQRFVGLCGILAPLIGISCILIAVSISPWFNWTENWISDLGGQLGDRPIYSVHGSASIILNVGLIIAGLLGITFAIGLRKIAVLRTRPGNWGTFFNLLVGCALTCIGIFPESTAPHGIVSVIFFFSTPFSLIFIGIAMLKHPGERKYSQLTIFLAFIIFLTIPLFAISRPVGSNGIIEMITIICYSLFSIIFGQRLLRGDIE